MKTAGIHVISLAAIFLVSAFAAAGEQPADSAFSQYRLTQVGANGVVTQQGSVLAVQQDNIKASPAEDLVYWCNSYRDRRVRQPIVCLKGGMSRVDLSQLRLLQVGEKVYLTNLQVKDNAVILDLQSCGACSSAPGTNDAPYRAEISFQLQKGYDMKQALEMVGQVLTFSTAGESPATAPAESAAATPEPQLAPIAPPPPPEAAPAAPKSIALGQTPEQVESILGQPKNILDLGTKKIYVYSDFKVTFMNGRMSSAE